MVRYTSPNHDVVINVSGGKRVFAVLEKAGFKSEFEINVEAKEEEKKEKLKTFVSSIKAIKKTCPICKKEFETKNPKTRTNSVKCGQILRRQEKR